MAPHGLVAELHSVQKIEFPGIRRHHEDLSVVVLEVDLAIPAGGRGFDLGPGSEGAHPAHFPAPGFNTAEALILEFPVENVEMTVVVKRRAHVGGDFLVLALPQELPILHIDGVDRAPLGRAGQRHPAPGHRGGHQAPVPDFVGVPCFPAPDLLAAGRVVPTQGVPPRDQQLQFAPLIRRRADHRAGEGLEGLRHRLGGPLRPPLLLTGGKIEGHQVGWNAVCVLLPPGQPGVRKRHVPLQHLHDEVSLEEDGTGGEGPLEGKILLPGRNHVFAPDLLAAHVVDNQFPVPEEEGHVLPVGHRGRGREVAPVIDMHPPFRDHSGPEDLTGGGLQADRMDLLFLAIDGIDKDVVIPDHRGGGRRPR